MNGERESRQRRRPAAAAAATAARHPYHTADDDDDNDETKLPHHDGKKKNKKRTRPAAARENPANAAHGHSHPVSCRQSLENRWCVQSVEFTHTAHHAPFAVHRTRIHTDAFVHTTHSYTKRNFFFLFFLIKRFCAQTCFYYKVVNFHRGISIFMYRDT